MNLYTLLCTSEDINNLSHGLQCFVKPLEEGNCSRTENIYYSHSNLAISPEQPMLSRTHGQTASPCNGRQRNGQTWQLVLVSPADTKIEK